MIKEVELGSVCHFENGDRGKNYPSQSAFLDNGIPFISAKNLDGYEINSQNLKFISDETYNKLGSGKLKPNDILFCLRGSLGKFAINNNNIKGAIASSLVLLRAKDELEINYLKHYLKSPRLTRLVKKSDNGSSQPNLSGANVKNFWL
jgi:type I restriction enzyme S subunit